jgi:hypothetical protein
MDHLKTGGTLLNMKFSPRLLADGHGIDMLAHLVRSYFKLDGHHLQFNVVTADTLRQAFLWSHSCRFPAPGMMKVGIMADGGDLWPIFRVWPCRIPAVRNLSLWGSGV